MLTFLFWNVNRQDRTDLAVQMVREWNADFLALAEFPSPGERLLTDLNPRGQSGRAYWALATASRIRVFCRFLRAEVRTVADSATYSVFEIARPKVPSLLVAVAHLPSKLRAHESEQRAACERLAEAIRDAEVLRGHRRSIVLGDLNVNPFEEGVVSARGLHAIGVQAVAARGSRTVHGQNYEFFYNPMWALQGDHAAGPPGTHYFHRSRTVEFFWHTFDQVLLRPALLPYYRDGGVRVLSRIGPNRLTDGTGRPNREQASDHFPILLQLEL